MTFHMSGDTWPAAFYFRAVLLNIPLTLIYGMILFLLGTVMYAYYANETCDPLEAGIVSNGNQVQILLFIQTEIVFACVSKVSDKFTVHKK